jgi:hypothetical protein
MSCKVHNNAKYEGLDELAKDLYNLQTKSLGLRNQSRLCLNLIWRMLESVCPTGHYDPRTKKIIILLITDTLKIFCALWLMNCSPQTKL